MLKLYIFYHRIVLLNTCISVHALSFYRKNMIQRNSTLSDFVSKIWMVNSDQKLKRYFFSFSFIYLLFEAKISD